MFVKRKTYEHVAAKLEATTLHRDKLSSEYTALKEQYELLERQFTAMEANYDAMKAWVQSLCELLPQVKLRSDRGQPGMKARIVAEINQAKLHGWGLPEIHR